MSNLDELLPVSTLAAEIGVPSSMVSGWISQGRKRKQPDQHGNTRVTLKYSVENGKSLSTRRWVAEFMEVAELGKAIVHIALSNLPNVE